MPVTLSVVSMHRGKRGMFAVFSDGSIRFRSMKRPNWRKIVGPKEPTSGGAFNVPLLVRSLTLGKSHLFAVCADGNAYCRKYGNRTWSPFDGPTS